MAAPRCEADKVIYDQTTKRLHAEGNVRLTEEDGKVTYGNIMDLSDDYRDGFVDSLRLDTPDQTRMAAARAERTSGNFTVFHNGVYTACAPCKDDPKKPPLWQVKAVRIIHDQGEKMIYFEDARLEFFGAPIAWLPYFSAPDPTVKRKTGMLMPTINSSSKYGLAVEVPYYWALAPDYDATIAPMITTKQGLLLQGEFRQRLINGAYSIRAAGIHQLEPQLFRAQRRFGADARLPRLARQLGKRGPVRHSTDKWVWGWDGADADRQDVPAGLQPASVELSRHRSVQTGTTEGISQIYLTGKGNRSYFDVRSIYYLRLLDSRRAEADSGHPSGDRLHYTFDHPMLGGELGYNINFTSLTRNQANFDAITQTALNAGTCCAAPPIRRSRIGQLPAARHSRHLQPLLGGDALAPQAITDSFGQVFTPFASLRADAASMQINNDPGVANYIATGDSNLVRAMPTVGVEYRYPFISVQSWGTQTIEPIAQVIARPNETADRQVAERGRAKPDLRRQQPVPRRQVLRLGPRRGRRPRQLRRAIYRAVQPRRLRQRAVRPVLQPVRAQFVRARRRSPIPASTAGSTPPAPTMWRASSYQPNSTYHLHLALPLRQRHVSPSSGPSSRQRQFRPLERQPALWRLCRPARHRLPRPSRRACSPPVRSSLTPTGCCCGPRSTTSRPIISSRTRSVSAMSTIASFWP